MHFFLGLRSVYVACLFLGRGSIIQTISGVPVVGMGLNKVSVTFMVLSSYVHGNR